MAFGEEILKSVQKNGLLPPPYRFTVVGDYGAYFENVESLGEISASRIVVRLGKVCAFVSGTELKISKYCAGDLVIEGKISGVGVQR